MILIVDSGSTKTDCIAIDKEGKILFETQTLGLNPQVLTNHILKERIVNNFELYKFATFFFEFKIEFALKLFPTSSTSGTLISDAVITFTL